MIITSFVTILATTITLLCACQCRTRARTCNPRARTSRRNWARSLSLRTVVKTHEGRDGLLSFEQPHTSQHSGQLKGVKCKVARRRLKHTSQTRGSSSPTFTNPAPGPQHFRLLRSGASSRMHHVTRSAQQRGIGAGSRKKWLLMDCRGFKRSWGQQGRGRCGD